MLLCIVTRLLAITLRTIAIAVLAKKAIEYCNMQLLTPKKYCNNAINARHSVAIVDMKFLHLLDISSVCI